jgi:hypothetical protein
MTAFIRCSSSVRDILVEDVLVDAICVDQRTAECAGDWLFSARRVAWEDGRRRAHLNRGDDRKAMPFVKRNISPIR